MSEKMSPPNKAVLVNVCIIGTLIWSYYSGYPLLAIAISAVVLLTLANVLIYIKSRKRS
jgi:CBS-domain-containing membrane protein